MNLSPTEEQQQLKDTVRRICAEHVTPERLAQWGQSPTGVDESLWKLAADLGWFGLGLPTVAGGSGLGLVEVAFLLEACGRGLIPRPIINAIRASMALAATDPGAAELASLASGSRRLALALAEKDASTPQHWTTELSRNAEGNVVDGEKWYVADAAAADLHLVAARRGPELVLALVDARHAETRPLRTFDGDRQARVRYVRSPITRLVADNAAPQLARLRRQQTALALAEMVGGMDGALAMTVEYVKQREQFGQKLAVFQAVQHQIADIGTSYTCARHLAWQAITRLAAGTEAGTELEMAAAWVGQAFKRLTLAAHHLHGGAGYVVEHPLHYFAERAQGLCIRDAPEAPALAAVAAALLD